jgi:hypothetical protein
MDARNTKKILEHSAFPTHYSAIPNNYEFSNGNMRSTTVHVVLDFQAGKDFGFGMFGRGGSSTASLGVRFAQFGQRSVIGAHGMPLKVNVYGFRSVAARKLPSI